MIYLDSLHERQRAEHLIADLRSFPFATAGFLEVRGPANRYGGTAVQSFPVLQFLPPGLPLPKFPGTTESQERVPLVGTRSTCTPRDCIFDIWIRPRLFNLPLNYETSWFLYSGLARLGLRPWVVGGRFEVKDGKLWESRTGVGQFIVGMPELAHTRALYSWNTWSSPCPRCWSWSRMIRSGDTGKAAA